MIGEILHRNNASGIVANTVYRFSANHHSRGRHLGTAHCEVPRGQAPRLHRVGPAPHPQANLIPPDLPRSGVGWKSHPNTRCVRGSRSLHHDPTAPVAPVGRPDWVLRGVAFPQCRSQRWMKVGNPSVGSLAVLFTKLYSAINIHLGFTLSSPEALALFICRTQRLIPLTRRMRRESLFTTGTARRPPA